MKLCEEIQYCDCQFDSDQLTRIERLKKYKGSLFTAQIWPVVF